MAYWMRIRDWSSDVCSSVLTGLYKRRFDVGLSLKQVSDSSLKSLSLWFEATALATPLRYPLLRQQSIRIDELQEHSVFRWKADYSPSLEIGRAACRGRVCPYVSISVDDVNIKKKKKY